MIAIGIMSGTSADGVDAIALELESAREPHEPRVLGHVYEAYPAAIKQALLAPADLTVPAMCALHFELAEIYARAALRLNRPDAAVAGMHGQTLWHAPPSTAPRVAGTLQIGSTAVLSHRLGIPAVGDLRGADVAEGGEGAPIVPFTHWFFTPPEARPRLVVNVGGIANLTAVHRDVDLVRGYDVGPGMMIADAYARSSRGGARECDEDGVISLGGAVVRGIVDRILAHPFVARTAPKSTGREDFGAPFYEPILGAFVDVPPADVMTSLLRATAELVATAAHEEGLEGAELVLTGGGAKNPTLRTHLAELLPSARVTVATGVLAPQHHEPAAVALIAARTLERLPSSLSRVTGARRASVLGHVHWP